MFLRVLVISSDAVARRQLRQQLETLEQVVVVAEAQDPADAPAHAKGGIDIAIVEVPEESGDARALDCIAHLLRRLPGIALMATGSAGSPDLVIRAIRAGAVEFLPRPVSREDLAAAVAKVRRLRQGAAPAESPRGQLTAVYASKGGLGVTTLATNLAVCLARQAPGTVLLIDLDLRQAAVSTLLNLQPRYSVLDAFGQVDRLDEAFLRGLLTPHPGGLSVLAAPREIARPSFTPAQIRDGLAVIRSPFAQVVLDLPQDLDPGTLAALEAADQILYLVGLDVPAVRVAAAGLAAFRHLGLDPSKIKLVAARAEAREAASVPQAEDALGVPLFWRLPNDYPTVMSSINEGTPLVLSAPRSEIARSLRQLSETVLGGPAAGDDGRERPSSLLERVWSLPLFRPGEV